MTNSPHKLFYKGKETDFVIFIDDKNLLDKYQGGDNTIPIIDIVSIFKVFVNRTGGVEGVLDEASNLDLENEFGTKNADEAIKTILKKGSDKANASVSNDPGSHNDSIGAGNTGN